MLCLVIQSVSSASLGGPLQAAECESGLTGSTNSDSGFYAAGHSKREFKIPGSILIPEGNDSFQ